MFNDQGSSFFLLCLSMNIGLPECVCPGLGELPNCMDKCKCPPGGKDAACRNSIECECLHGGKFPNCEPSPIVTEKCDPKSYWAYDPVEKKELCICLNGGEAPQCADAPPCDQACQPEEMCVTVDGVPQCVCLNGMPKCGTPSVCTKECPEGKCVIDEKNGNKEVCLCPNNGNDYPACKGCKKECPGGQCATDTTGKPICICKYEKA